jgi:hypothetical protein
MAPRVVDFDVARRERKREPVVLRIGGRDYTLSAGVPAGLALDMLRYRVAGTDDVEIPDDAIGTIGRRLFGRENWEAILDDAGLELGELRDLIEMTFRALNGEDDGPPNRATRRTARRGSAGSKTGA